MNNSIRWMVPGVLLVSISFFSCQKNADKQNLHSEVRLEALNKKPSTAVTANVSVFANGLNNPRGLKFGPDGNLYVAEGGLGGANSTVGQCTQVVPPVGPYTGSPTGGRISRIDGNGVVSTVTDQFPSSQTSVNLGSLISGVADVAFLGNTLYALVTGGACEHGVPEVSNGIFRVNANGSWTMIADLGAWSRTMPVANPEPDDFEPPGTWYSMEVVRGDFYALEPNHGELVKVTPGGDISRVVDLSATWGHVVPTALAYHGNFYIGNLSTFGPDRAPSAIFKVNPAGQSKKVADDLSMVLGLVIDHENRMYVLESTVGAPFPTPGLGRIQRIDPNGKKTVIASGFNLPTGMTLGPDGNLYVSNWGFGNTGAGQILKVEIAE